MTTSSPLRLLPLFVLAALLGFFMVLLYPLLVVLWLSWREHERAALLSAAMPGAVVCNGGTMRICANPDCGWIGQEDDCVDWKHPTGARFCPECHEVTEAMP